MSENSLEKALSISFDPDEIEKQSPKINNSFEFDLDSSRELKHKR